MLRAAIQRDHFEAGRQGPFVRAEVFSELLLVRPSEESYRFYGRFGCKDLREPLVLPLHPS
jgi:hypothetical protein